MLLTDFINNDHIWRRYGAQGGNAYYLLMWTEKMVRSIELYEVTEYNYIGLNVLGIQIYPLRVKDFGNDSIQRLYHELVGEL